MVYIILGDGFEEIEAISPGDILRRGGVEVCYAGIGGTVIRGGHNICVAADVEVDQIDLDQAEMLVIPGGLGGVESILASPVALEKLKGAYDRDIELAAICAGPTVLGHLGIMDGRKAVCYPGLEEKVTGGSMQPGKKVVRDRKLTTGQGPGAAMAFGLALLDVLKGKQTAEEVGSGLLYDGK